VIKKLIRKRGSGGRQLLASTITKIRTNFTANRESLTLTAGKKMLQENVTS